MVQTSHLWLQAKKMKKKNPGSEKVQPKKMSAEAADREAATSSRPCTPPQTSWFEFLLDDSLMEAHLQKLFPGTGF